MITVNIMNLRISELHMALTGTCDSVTGPTALGDFGKEDRKINLR